MAGGSNGYRATLVRRQLTLVLISSLPGTAGLQPFISFSTSYPELPPTDRVTDIHSHNVKRAGRYAMDLLYTSDRSGTISLDRNGEPLTSPITITSTRNDQDPLAWRQWHDWDCLKESPSSRCVYSRTET